MGWWEDRWDGKKVTVGDEPIDLVHEMLRAFADAYAEDVGRKPNSQEFVFALLNALQTTGRERFGDLEAREVASVKLATRKAPRSQRFQVGDFFAIPLATGESAYGRVINQDAAGQAIEVYRLTTKRPLSFAQLRQRDKPTLFQTHVNGLLAFRKCRWPILGHAELAKDHPMPTFRLGHHETGWLGKRGKTQGAISTEEALRLEPCVCWDPETVEERLTSGHPEVWPGLEEWQWADFGDTYLPLLRQPEALRNLYLNRAAVSDAGLGRVANCSRLRVLYLSGQPITDAGLRHLAGLMALEELNLGGTRITDAGLVHLHGLKNLRKLGLVNTAVTDQGVGRLKKVLRRVAVKR
jgi:hypothetical protein